VASIEEGADAVILQEELEIEIRSVTNATVRYHERAKVLTKNGADQFRVASVGYQPGVEIRSLRGSVTPPSGKPLKIKKRQIFDGAAFASYELYSDSRHRSIAFTGITPGSIVEHSYELSVSNLALMPQEFRLQELLPVQLKSLTIRVPASFPLRLSVEGGSPEYERKEKGGVVTHRWRTQDVPALKLDRGTPPVSDLLPKVRMTPKQIVWGDRRIDANTWNGIAHFYWDLARDRMEPTPEVAQKARELAGSEDDVLEKTRRLYEFVQKKVNYVAIALDIGGWQPHSNGDVLRHLYGDCKDKATLLIAMLRSVDLKGFPVLIRTREAGQLDRDTPYLSFNHAIVAVPSDEGYLFMDPTSEDTPFGDLPWGDQGVSVLVVKEDGDGELMETPLFPAERNRRHITVRGQIGASGRLEGECTLEAWGQRQRYLSALVDARTTVREDVVAAIVSWLSPGAQLESQEIIPPSTPTDALRVEAHISVPGFVSRVAGIEFVSPHVIRFPTLSALAAYSGRSQPVFLAYPFSDTVETRLQLPPGRTIKKLPEDRAIEGAGLKANTSYELTREDRRNVLIIRRSISISRREIPVEEYEGFYAFVGALAEEEAGAITLKSEF
jgi:hypothetical protein